jgi:hypothetical protein
MICILAWAFIGSLYPERGPLRYRTPHPQRWPTSLADHEVDANATLSPWLSEIDDWQSLHELRQALGDGSKIKEIGLTLETRLSISTYSTKALLLRVRTAADIRLQWHARQWRAVAGAFCEKTAHRKYYT